MLKLGGPALEGPDETLLQHQKTRETVLSVGLSIGSLHGLKHAQNNNICYYQSLSPVGLHFSALQGWKYAHTTSIARHHLDWRRTVTGEAFGTT